MRDLAGSNQTVKIADVIERCVDKGFKPDQVSYEPLAFSVSHAARVAGTVQMGYHVTVKGRLKEGWVFSQ